jgi:hypothetical protein
MTPMSFSHRSGYPGSTLLGSIAVVMATSWANADEPNDRTPKGTMPAAFTRLLPLYTKLGPPQPGDFSKREGLKPEQKFYEKSLAILEGAK